MLVCKNSNKITDYFNTKFSNLSDYQIQNKILYEYKYVFFKFYIAIFYC